jgi:REP element-mobilizing transposase RayT
MPRGPRIDFPGARHHVLNRGARKAPIFESPEAKEIFVEALAELPGRFGVRVHGYALMPNHFHLLLGTPRGNLSRAMRHLGATTTQRLNARRSWDGPIFRGRYKNRVVGDMRYWMHLLAYVHLNPVPSLVERPEDWAWSTHRAYLGLDPVPDWLTTTDFDHVFGSRKNLLMYIDEHLEGRGTAPDGWNPADLWTPEPSGVAQGYVELKDPRPRLAQEAIDEVSEITGTSEEALIVPRRGRGDRRSRWLAAWWIGRRAALTHREVAAYMSSTGQGVANMHYRLRQRLEAKPQDVELASWMTALEALP